ncbi:hypothetical protein TNCV_2552621 [Trichonephila clavipes]|nr:hypothetical protein TNCV_2552621 [Trichonephila clavipes]
MHLHVTSFARSDCASWEPSVRGRDHAEDDERAGHTRYVITDQNIAKIRVMSTFSTTSMVYYIEVLKGLDEAVQAKTENLLNGSPKASFQNCFQQWQQQMQICEC